MAMLTVVLASCVGGIVQAVTGFGGGIVIMIFLPFLFSINAAPAISDIITMLLALFICVEYRKYINVKKMILPISCYAAVSGFAIYQSAHLDVAKLKMGFGIFMIALACYFLFFSAKVKLKSSIGMNVVCAVLAGLGGGLFSISGPPAGLYFLAATDSKEEYLGTLNTFFALTILFNSTMRIANGFTTVDLLPYMAFGSLACFVGCKVGGKIAHRLSMDGMRKCVYGLMIFGGATAIIQSL